MAATHVERIADNDDSSDLPRRIARAAAIAATAFGLLYLLGVTVNLATNGTTHSTSEPVQVFSSVIALLWNMDLVVLFTALRWTVPANRKFWMDLAWGFMLLVCATSCINWFVRLIVVPQVALAGDSAALALIDPNGARSIMFGVEHLGWGLFLAAAAGFGALAFSGRGLDGWIRGLLGVVSLFSLLHVVGLAVGVYALDFLGYVAWAAALPAATWLVAIRLKNH
jgi:hypothetical protein